MKTFSDFMQEIMEFTAVKKRMDKGADAKKRRREANKDYKRNKIKINIARKKKKKKDDSSGVTKKRERMAKQGKTMSGERITKRIK